MSENEKVQETTEDAEKTTEVTETTEVDTNKSINASLDEIDDPDVLKQMVKKLRGENAKTRTEKQANKAELEAFQAWKESQMTELEKAQARAASLEEDLKAKTLALVLRDFELDEDAAEFVDGSSEDEMRAKAEKLAGYAGRTKQSENSTGLVPDLFKTSAGNPVKTRKDDGGEFLSWLAQRDLGA